MHSTPQNFTVAEYCQQYDNRQIVINADYQRSSKVWPISARSYLIDTILFGYPIPKILLRQRTDLRTRTTIKEVVDGQQRTAAIVDFFHDRLTITQGAFSGHRYSNLEDEQKQAFIGYTLSADIFPEATDEDIREVFRRINSYTVPLNRQELRYATFQGPFKWFIAGLAHRYAQPLKDWGIFREQQLARMADAELLTEIVRALLYGIETSSPSRLDKTYKQFESEFPQQADIEQTLDEAFSVFLTLTDLKNSALMTRYHFYSLLTAIAHAARRFPHLPPFPPGNPLGSLDQAKYNLSILAEALETPDAFPDVAEFVQASIRATNTKDQRLKRFRWMCRALVDRPLLP